MNVFWNEVALAALDEIRSYIAERSGEAVADRVADRIFDHSEQIGKFPYSGRVIPEIGDPSIREVFEGPYRILYTVHDEWGEVLTVLHGSRELLE